MRRDNQSMRTEHADVAASAISYAAPTHLENTAAYITDIRAVDLKTRTIGGVVAPYHGVSALTPHPSGERIMPGAFTKSLAGRETKIPLVVGHARHTEAAVGRSRSWQDTVIGLRGEFVVKPGPEGDRCSRTATAAG